MRRYRVATIAVVGTLGLLAVVPLGVADNTQVRDVVLRLADWTARLITTPLVSIRLDPADAPGATITAVTIPADDTTVLEVRPEPEARAVAAEAGAPAALEEEEALASAQGGEVLAGDVTIEAAVPVGSVTPITDALNVPMFTTYLPGDERIFVVERAGRIKIIKNGMIQNPVFLDISARVRENGEEGMQSMAFDPNFATNGRFYVFYNVDPGGDTRISRFIVGSDPNVADFNSEVVMLTIPQPDDRDNHKGGTIAFRPTDGFLYAALGDGGSGNDPDEFAQKGTTLLGKMLRLNMSGNSAAPAAGNPFLDPNDNILNEIWSLGFRNPFRWSFDSANGDIWIGDVGEAAREEIDYEPANTPGGRNYGWDVREGKIAGSEPFLGPLFINAPPFVDPIHDYDHSAGRCSVTGGSVYHGSVGELLNQYLFADWCTGEMWSFNRTSGAVTDHTSDLAPASAEGHVIVAITEGAFKEAYVVHLDGDLYRIGNTGNDCGTTDGQDEDGDGKSNFPDDPGCSSTSDPSELNSGEPCDDGFDNDRDGAIDFPDDPGCTSPNSGEEGLAESDCDDNIDNDTDGATDFPDDPGCLSAITGSEERLDPDCNDGIDNDGDLRTDFPADPGCSSATTGRESLEDPGGGGGGSCGLGFELIFVLPPLVWLRQRRRRS